MSRRARLGADEVLCAECGQTMLRGAAAGLNQQHFHPYGCFDEGLRKWVDEIDRRVVAGIGSLELNVTMESVSPAVLKHLGELAAGVVRARRAAR